MNNHDQFTPSYHGHMAGSPQRPNDSASSGSSSLQKRGSSSTLELGPRKNRKPFSLCSLMCLKIFSRTIQDALVHHGRHFGHVVHTFCNIQTLLTNGISLIGEQADAPEENLMAV